MAKETVIQLYHTLTPDEAPSPGDLLPGEVSIELASNPRRVWVGVPDTIHADEQVLLIGGSVFPSGGAIYDVLSKASATDGDVEWRGAGQRPNNNTVIGAGAFNSTTVQVQSTAVGAGALAASTTGLGRNAAYGFNALAANTSGSQNVAVGFSAFSANTSGSFNAVIGSGTLGSYNGNGNSVLGANAFPWLTTGETNIAIGQNVGTYFGTGSGNADRLLTATRCIYIGAEVRSIADNPANEIVIGSRGAAIPIIGNGSNTITLGNADVTALYTRAGLVLGDDPTGGAKGPGTINLPASGGYFIDGEPLSTGGTRTVSWVAGANPTGGTILFADRDMTIKSITGVVEIINGMAATVSVVRAAEGTAIPAAMPIHTGVFDTNSLTGVYQDLPLNNASGEPLAAGERLGLRTTGTFFDSAGSITVEYE